MKNGGAAASYNESAADYWNHAKCVAPWSNAIKLRKSLAA